MSAVRDRADAVAAMPHVRRWLRRLHRVARDMPPEVWVYVASGSPHIMARSDDGEPIFNERGCVDQDAAVDVLDRKNGSWDGGDW